MKKIFKSILWFLIEIVLFFIAWLLILPLTLLNVLIVAVKYRKKVTGYFLETAKNIDIFGNKEYRTLFNTILIKKSKSLNHFGGDETISSVLGKNQLTKTLTITGKILVYILNLIDKNHCIKAIEEEIEHIEYGS